jgi:hypothetical protein
MSLIKKCDVKQYFLTHPHTGPHSFRPVKKHGLSDLSEIEPDDASANTPGFVEDYLAKHSSSDASAISISIPASSGRMAVSVATSSSQE